MTVETIKKANTCIDGILVTVLDKKYKVIDGILVTVETIQKATIGGILVTVFKQKKKERYRWNICDSRDN